MKVRFVIDMLDKIKESRNFLSEKMKDPNIAFQDSQAFDTIGMLLDVLEDELLDKNIERDCK